MPPGVTGRTKPTKTKKQARSLKRKRETEELEKLEQAIAELDPKDPSLKTFADLPLSRPTRTGLEMSRFTTLTDIQARAIPLALKGADCLGAAKTGSGKTLAFLVPALELLYRRRWTELDGLGALIIAPTRELAIQIFEVLRQVGRCHSFSAGLVIGGKSLREERERVGRMNLLVCTPGRMLQHLDQTAAFDVGGLQLLVLDEADRILDMGFRATVDALLAHLPPQRQTLLFSATQTKRVSDLARLSLRSGDDGNNKNNNNNTSSSSNSDAVYISVHEAAPSATPAALQQHYVVTPLPAKLDTLYSFLRSNARAKTLVFLASGKQVRFVYESFRRLRPGVPLLHLHGRQKQTARLDVTARFAAARHACLFATDVAARGLDFPAVDWVLQLDCPEDADTYIHRVGRTARFGRGGRAVLLLAPSEAPAMLQRLAQRRVPVERTSVRAQKQQSIRAQLQDMCFKDPELKYLGQKAFISYVRSVHLQKDKEVFQLAALPLDEFSASLGLPGAPRVKFLKGEDPKALKNAPRQMLLALSSDDDDDDDNDDGNNGGDSGGDGEAAAGGEKQKKTKKQATVRTKYDRMFERRNQSVLAEHYTKIVQDEDDEPDGNGHRPGGNNDEEADEDDDFLTVKRRLDLDSKDDEFGDDDDNQSDADGGDVNGVNRSAGRSGGGHGGSNGASTAAGTGAGGSAGAGAGTAKRVILAGAAGSEPLLIDSKRRERLLQSRKKLLKLKGRGTKLLYDDDGRAHAVYELEDETHFRQRGDPEAQRQRFVAAERSRVVAVDATDKQLAKAKRREKRERRKAREAGEAGARLVDDGGGAVRVRLAPYDDDDVDDDNADHDDDDDDDDDDDGNGDTGGRRRRGRLAEEERDDDDEENEVSQMGPPSKRRKKWSEREEKSGQHRRRDNGYGDGDGDHDDDDDDDDNDDNRDSEDGEEKAQRQRQQKHQKHQKADRRHDRVAAPQQQQQRQLQQRRRQKRHERALDMVDADADNLEDLEALATEFLD